MNYIIKEKFTVKDLEVNDLMYDSKIDRMVKVLYIGHITSALGIFAQVVVEEVGSKLIQVIDIYGDSLEMPMLSNGRFRYGHLIKFTETEHNDKIALYVPHYPSYPSYPYYSSYPYYPYIYYTTTGTPYISYDITTSTNPNQTQGSVTSQTSPNDISEMTRETQCFQSTNTTADVTVYFSDWNSSSSSSTLGSESNNKMFENATSTTNLQKDEDERKEEIKEEEKLNSIEWIIKELIASMKEEPEKVEDQKIEKTQKKKDDEFINWFNWFFNKGSK